MLDVDASVDSSGTIASYATLTEGDHENGHFMEDRILFLRLILVVAGMNRHETHPFGE